MTEPTYYEKVSEFQDRLAGLIKSLTEAQKTISPSLKDRATYPGLVFTTPKKEQRVLLTNAWIVLRQTELGEEFESDLDELFALLNEEGNCPVQYEPEFQGYAVGE